MPNTTTEEWPSAYAVVTICRKRLGAVTSGTTKTMKNPRDKIGATLRRHLRNLPGDVRILACENLSITWH